MIRSFVPQKTMQKPKNVIITLNMRSDSDLTPTKIKATTQNELITLKIPQECVPGRTDGPPKDAAYCVPARSKSVLHSDGIPSSGHTHVGCQEARDGRKKRKLGPSVTL